MKTPVCRLTVDGQDMTDTINPRLIELTVTAKRDDDADTLEFALDATDGRLALPKKGAMVTVELGFKGEALVSLGSFKVTGRAHAGPPDKITVRGESADFTATFRVREDRSWDGKTVGEVLSAVAGRQGLKASIAPELASQSVGNLAQSRQSDAALLRRLGKQFDAVATVKAGSLIFAPIGATTTPSGAALPAFEIVRADGDGHTYQDADRDAYSEVSAAYHDDGEAKRKRVKVGDDGDADAKGKTKRLARTYASEAEAKKAAQAEMNRLKRGAATFSYSLAYGRPDLYPNRRGRVSGFHPEIDAVEWLIAEAKHTFSPSSGLTTSLELETAP